MGARKTATPPLCTDPNCTTVGAHYHAPAPAPVPAPGAVPYPTPAPLPPPDLAAVLTACAFALDQLSQYLLANRDKLP